ncbi:hypothetical protein PF001_g10455 [Phytophthora fragariae]|uniref:DUF6604 domain-containing protein n=1 Tax=Phytophthora fragariae TaxID=53985 RepID=A0A6A4DX44_9STRA|nr:hypothetical protein PF001_g10455 [Phytophthora fragariae]
MSSFPAGKYARYKRATAFFLDWLLRAAGGELPKALAACRYAILLREHVAAFFPDDDEGQTGHQFFLELLQSWHRSLKTVDVAREELAAVELDNVMFENYYEVLQVDEDFFPDEGKFEVEPEAPKTAKVDRERLFEEAFADELRMELVYLFMELDELLEGVYKVYCEVKQETRTMVEATVVVKLALDTASALTAELQLKYPTLRSAKDMFNIVRNISQKSFRQRILQLHQSIMDELRAAYDSEEDKAVKYVPGTFLIELLGVGTTLDSFVASIPADSNNASGIFFPSGIFGETYGEDRTQLYVLLPDTNNDKVFLMQQLPMLFNAMADRRNAGKSGIELAPMEPFMLLMEKFFSTREVTIPVCFACICWMKSVAALQGRGGLGRNISLTYKHSTELMKNMDAAVESNKALLANNLLRRCASEIKQSTAFRHVGRANPLFAGFLMMNHHFQYLHIANEVIFSTPLLRAFGHLYNALVQEGYLEHIPFFDEVLKVYAQEIFTPSRAAATHGGYYRTYLLSSNLRASAIDAVYRGENFPVGSEAYKKRKAFHLSDVSKIFRLMRLNDKSVLSGGSWKARLEAVSDTFGADLRIKDGKGRSVSQVTSNKEWARKIAAGTAQYDAFDAINAGKLNARVNPQDSATAELLRQFMAAQHDQKGLDTRGSTGMNTEEGKKSKKKGKRSKKGGAEEQSIIAAAAAQGTTEVETARVLLRLLDAAGSEVNEDHESESLPVLEDKLRKLSVAIFARLRDPNISASKKTRDTHDACRLIKELRSLVKTFSEPSKLNSARHHIRLVIAAEAVHGIHLMQKLYRAQDAAITVVELTPVRQLCETTQLFTKFVVGTARLCVSVDRAPQAREILDVLEKRFLKTPFDKRVPSEFRELVQMYSTAREEMGLGQTSSAKTLRSLEWYLTSAVDNYNVQLTLDGLAGRPVYFEIRPAASVSDKEVLLLTVGVNVIIELKAVACLGGQDKRIIYGGTSKADLARVRAMVLRVAERLEVPLDTQSMNSCTASVHVGGFEFSSAGILRNAPAS